MKATSFDDKLVDISNYLVYSVTVLNEGDQSIAY